MNKAQAINLLGGSVTAAAQAIGVTASAVTQWPDDLPPRIVDRVQAALWRKSQSPADTTWPHPGGRPCIDVATPAGQQEVRDAA